MTINTRLRINAYTCQKCKEVIYTTDKNDGVTPFMIPCLTDIKELDSLVNYPKNRRKHSSLVGCNGVMYSHFYRAVVGIPTFEWFKPVRVKLYSSVMQEYIKNGGLDLRKIIVEVK